MKFQEGQVVYLKSGGPAMTIDSFNDTGEIARCDWHDGHNMRQHSFHITSLMTAKPDYSAITRQVIA